MEWFANVIVPVLIAMIPAVCMLVGTLAGVKAQLKETERKAEEHRNEIEEAREKKEQDRETLRDRKDEERQKRQEEVLRCLLRSELLTMYFKHIERDDEKLTQWESENMHKMADAYAGLNGNSFVDQLVAKMGEWKVVKN